MGDVLSQCHRRSQGVQWAHLHTQGGEKIRRNSHGKSVTAAQAEQESIFGTFFAGLGRFEA